MHEGLHAGPETVDSVDKGHFKQNTLCEFGQLYLQINNN
jgi:hypothetical protein